MSSSLIKLFLILIYLSECFCSSNTPTNAAGNSTRTDCTAHGFIPKVSQLLFYEEVEMPILLSQ